MFVAFKYLVLIITALHNHHNITWVRYQVFKTIDFKFLICKFLHFVVNPSVTAGQCPFLKAKNHAVTQYLKSEMYRSFFLQWDYKTLNIVKLEKYKCVYRVFFFILYDLNLCRYFCTLPHLHAISVCWQILGTYSKTNSPFSTPKSSSEPTIYLLWFSTLEPAPTNPTPNASLRKILANEPQHEFTNMCVSILRVSAGPHGVPFVRHFLSGARHAAIWLQHWRHQCSRAGECKI